MSHKPVFVATHPRACSTAFERVFMTRQHTLQCAHEPFGDAFYYGPERLGERYADDEAGRISSGFSKTTYQDVLNRLDQDGGEGKRVFIKDMAYYLMPPNSGVPSIAPSLRKHADGEKPGSSHHVNGVNGHSQVDGVNGHNQTNGTNGVNGIDQLTRQGSDTTGNPTVIPVEILKKFHWTFLIRHPRRGIPSYVRCCSPPLSETTGRPAGNAKREKDEVSITVLDADDLLNKPEEAIRAFCDQTGIPFSSDMLQWDDEENQKRVTEAFAKWNGWHNDAINSKGLTARTCPKKPVTEESENEEWRQKYGEEGQKIIRACVEENTPHYEYLKSFALEF
ncbi:hypothetical protein O1611_g9430 [Lasiodiplodia mahajangana]|uniref:Uncharacterized protein n=1 Tax=Lasiodiplodia mahajangana TaxID=1108764 RepID=A0ACC2J9V8_9PEZI|nr:hypothetical protein O1611_g9430 [Lasiodiplodia mahajangana]